jgi:ornithine carbamoyltransferase
MVINLRNRHFLNLLDFKPAEIEFLLEMAAELKWAKKSGTEEQRLVGKNIALIFEKASTRTSRRTATSRWCSRATRSTRT